MKYRRGLGRGRGLKMMRQQSRPSPFSKIRGNTGKADAESYGRSREFVHGPDGLRKRPQPLPETKYLNRRILANNSDGSSDQCMAALYSLKVG